MSLSKLLTPNGWITKMVAVAVAGSAALGFAGSAMQSSAAQSAADTQAAAAGNAAQLQFQATQNALAQQQGMFNTTQANLSPFVQSGAGALNTLGAWAGAQSPYTPYNYQPFSMTQAQLEATPGYQFTLNQGLLAAQNSSIATGASGNALRAAADYATGDASTTYNQQFQNWQTQQQNLLNANVTNYNASQAGITNQFNRVLALANLGESAAAGVGSAATQTGANMANTLLTGTGQQTASLIGGANAQAAGTIGSANAIAGGLSNAGNNVQSSLILNALLSQNGGPGLFGSASTQPYVPF